MPPMIPRNLRKFVRNLGYGLGERLLPVLHRRSAILCFHALGSEHPGHLSLERFRSMIDWISEKFNVRTVRNLPLDQTKRPSPTVSLSFDDAYRSHFTVGRRILNERNLRGTFFVPTNYLGKDFPASDATYPCMHVEEIRTLSEEGHEIGAHSHTHSSLTDITRDEVRRELERSRTILNDLIEPTVTSFAYPSGMFDDRIVELLRQVGFQRAVTTEPCLMGTATDPLRIPRIPVSNQLTLRELKVKLSPLNRIVRMV